MYHHTFFTYNCMNCNLYVCMNACICRLILFLHNSMVIYASHTVAHTASLFGFDLDEASFSDKILLRSNNVSMKI